MDVGYLLKNYNYMDNIFKQSVLLYIKLSLIDVFIKGSGSDYTVLCRVSILFIR